MKKIKLFTLILTFVLVIALVFGGCSDSGDSQNSPDVSSQVNNPSSFSANDFSSDYWQNVTTEGYETRTQNASYGGGYFVSTNIGTYFENDFDYSCEIGDLYIVEYAESPLGPWIPLCGKPNCRHNSMMCNAYISDPLMGVYNSRIYYSNGSSGLKSMALDGTNHRSELTADQNLFVLGATRTGIMSDGYMYYMDISYEEDKAQIFRISVEEKNATRENVEFVISSDYYFTGLSAVKPYKNHLGIYCSNPKNSNIWKNYLYDFETKELLEIPENLSLMFFNDNLAYFKNTENFSEIYTYDLETKLYEKLFTVDTPKDYAAYCDGTYIYAEEYGNSKSPDAPYIIRVYDLSGNLIAQGETPKERGVADILSSQMFYEATKDAVYFVGDNYRPCYALLKSEIAEGKINFIQIYSEDDE